MLKVLTFPVWFPLWLFFYVPGKLTLELQYLYPGRGQVFGSGRRKNNVFAAIVSSLGYWVIILFILVLSGAIKLPIPALESQLR